MGIRIRDAVVGVLLGLPLLNGCKYSSARTIEKQFVEDMSKEAPGLALYDKNKNEVLDTNGALLYIRARILPEYGRNGQLTDRAIEKIKKISSKLHYCSKVRWDDRRISRNLITDWRTAQAFDEALEILLKEQKDTAEKLVKSEKK